jgi:hypothetical protein
MTLHSVAATAALLASAAGALAQIGAPELIIKRTDTPINAPDEFWPTSSFDSASIDNAGNVLFSAQLDVSGVGTAVNGNRRMVIRGTPGNLVQVARDGNPTGSGAGPLTPGATRLNNPNNWWHNSFSATSSSFGLQTNSVMTSSGSVYIASALNGPGASSTNNTAFWTGPATAPVHRAQRGITTVAGGAGFATNLNFSSSSVRINNSGQTLIQSALSGGDVVGTTNDNGFFRVNTDSTVTTMYRRGDVAPRFGDSALRLGTAPTFGYFMNEAGKFATLATVTGGTVPAVTSGALQDNNVVFNSLRGSLDSVVRQGETTGLSSGLSYAKGAFPFGQLNNPLSATSHWFPSRVEGTGVNATNDTVLMESRWDAGLNQHVLTQHLRRGDASPFAGANFNTWNTANSRVHGNNNLILAGTLADAGGGVTTANDEYILFRDSATGTLTPFAREGALLSSFTSNPAALGSLPADAVFGNNLASGSFPGMNALNTVIFQARFTGTGITPNVNDTGIFVWTPSDGLSLVARTGSVVDPSMAAWIQLSYQNGAAGGGTMFSLSDTNWFTFRAADSFNNNALYRVIVPAPGAGLLALVGAGFAARRRRARAV